VIIRRYPEKDKETESEGEEDVQSDGVALANECSVSLTDVGNCNMTSFSYTSLPYCVEGRAH
jgi:hypothetical protein